MINNAPTKADEYGMCYYVNVDGIRGLTVRVVSRQIFTCLANIFTLPNSNVKLF